jgi:hypothetical protein
MNSSRARCGIPAVPLVAFLFISPLLFAQVKVKTPGAQFSLVAGQATVDNVADGRRFRGDERAELKIRGTLRVPPGAGTSGLHKMQRLAIHFHASPQGPSVISVQLCNGANCKYTFTTDLRGDYTARETVYTNGAQYGNVWLFNPPEMVGSQSAVVLKIRFPGGIDSKIDPGEFILTSVEAEFPVELQSPQSVMNNSQPISTGRAKSPTSIWPNGKAYFFKGDQYVRYDAKTDKADPNYPQPIAGHWSGFPPDFEAGVDAEVVWGNGKVYFFKGDQYVSFDIASDKVDAGYPQPIVAHWPGLWTGHIDAGVVWPNGKAYFFRGSEYVRYDIATDKADPGYPAAIRDTWNGFPASFAAGIDGAVVWNNGKAYFFKGSEYIRYDIATDKTDLGPVPIVQNWHGLW